MTRNLKLFTLVAGGSIVAYAIVFGLIFASHKTVDATMVFWFLLVSLSVGLFKEHYEEGDDARAVRYDLHKRYTLLAVGAIAVTSVLWLLLWRANYILLASIELIVLTALYAYGAVMNRNRIKGLKAKDIFK